ncbi:hypothetical protein K435DRAFT_793779 [Dendrothele bispora CBS 962.96]|uniref:Nucleoside diphosphate kinase n=1 Tax=Dendrothele bispora (strain CBS 962.96) TaxID=1314807 RepID=A0A4S8MFD4_DENBC|nr:hypothetical protein K435DRAFT_682463 [Dendrothele bispora CBS 962.96]THV00804.1 hypothetical protein K435DRAFT_793779 [Dendrothele bispora CBS 962.96]
MTRTVAIIKHHALSHRFDIEPRIQEASFEIVKERQMEFDVESDPETLYELFGEDAESLGEGPVWVYVLERRRAVEVWNTLMGDRDPEVARENAPNSLRALYGTSTTQNAVMGSPDDEMAEIQIASLFASSPPFPTSDLPLDDGRFATMGSVSSSVLSALQAATSDEGYARSNPSSTAGGSAKLVSNGSRRASFKARALPATHDKPDIVPRTTRAADLRAGVTVLEKIVPRVPISKERLAQTFANVPGHKRAETISVASTAAPVVAPRMTKAAALRLGIQPTPTTTRKTSDNKATFEGVPGHKRRESIAVASVAAPTVAPRLNKSAALRQQKDSAPPTSFMFRGPSAPKVPGLSRSNSSSSLQNIPHSRPPSARPPSATGTASRTSSRPPAQRTTSTTSNASTSTNRSAKPNGSTTKASSVSPSETPSPSTTAAPKLRPRPSSISMPPTIAPRTNKSAALRAAKKEQEAQAAAAAQRRAPGRATRPPPSSMPTGLVV